ncbi:MAG TPA: GNAT family N-acetyltransferase [Allosphingosinicella sp.]|nr:GNAT family N-acetyltransferase [Allosphingosinicella sp.]
MTAVPPPLTLEPLTADADVSALADALAPAFHGEVSAARDVLAQTVDLLARDPRPSPWGSYLAVEDGRPVGLCAFKAAPDRKGVVEIAYMTFPAFEGRGHAGAMAAALTGIAFAAGAPLVTAHTLPEENASTRALLRNGFAFVGETIDPEDGLVWRWERRCGT